MCVAKRLTLVLFALSSILRAAEGLKTPVPFTILVDFEKPHSSQSFEAMRLELESLLRPVGLKFNLQLRDQMAEAQQFADLVLFKMKGSCIMDSLPIGALSDERGPLAMAYASDGEVLHFGEVECDRIRESLSRAGGRFPSGDIQSTLGRALGLVIGHELYHMLANSTKHTKNGVTKESLSARELLSGELTLPALARKALQQALISAPPPVALTANALF